jgi:hypothetical protein
MIEQAAPGHDRAFLGTGLPGDRRNVPRQDRLLSKRSDTKGVTKKGVTDGTAPVRANPGPSYPVPSLCLIFPAAASCPDCSKVDLDPTCLCN